ncbi:MAG TPA: hypothetical protein VJ464_15830 [Blastocatellia bacterium]|nr:hypothetical protein [Blastocatellia bacterium]
MISPEERRSRKCEACSHARQLWQSILDHTADETTDPPTLYGDLANHGLYIHRKVTEFGCRIEQLDAFDYELLLIVSAEIKRRESFKVWEQNRKLEQK